MGRPDSVGAAGEQGGRLAVPHEPPEKGSGQGDDKVRPTLQKETLYQLCWEPAGKRREASDS